MKIIEKKYFQDQFNIFKQTETVHLETERAIFAFS